MDPIVSAGCSAMSWRTEEGLHLWGRTFDFHCLPPDTRITHLPRGTAYRLCDSPAAPAQTAAYAAMGTGLLLPALPAPALYEGINDQGLMGGQLYYRTFAHYPAEARPGTLALQPPLLVYHLLAKCASVEEAVRTLEEEITPVSLPLLGSVPPLHWAFTDRSGETVIVEPDQEGLRIYRRTVGVMTNSPGYSWHRLNLLNYAGARDLEHLPPDLEDCPASCFSASGSQSLPGGWTSPARFVRLAFLRRYALRGTGETDGVARMFRLFQSAAFPLGIARLEEEGHAWDYTVYTSVMCAETRRFYWTTHENQRIQVAELDALAGRTAPVQLELGREADFAVRTPR